MSKRQAGLLGLLGIVVGAVMLALFVGNARAAGLQVTTTEDSLTVNGNCSLREAIEAANTDTAVDACPAGSGADTITFSVSGTITLTSELVPKGQLTIDGSGQSITISGGDTTRVLHPFFGADLSLVNLTIAHGTSASEGGGVRADGSGSITVTNTAFLDNSATGSPGDGGAIWVPESLLTVTNSTFSGNSAVQDGGAIRVFGFGHLTVTNSTFSGNSASTGNGGAIATNAGTTTVTNSTFSGNSAVSGGGVSTTATPQTFFTLENTILTNSPSGGNCGGIFTDGGYNLDSGTSCGFTALTSLSSTDPLLGALGDDGGPTKTMALQAGNPGSPAINKIPAGENGCGTTIVADQRGVTRPQGATCDIGAFEVQQATITTQVSATTAIVGQTSITDTATLSGQNGTATGSVAFFVCGPTGGATPCVSGGTPAGTGTLNAEQATSDAFTPSAAGTHCFRAEYTPDSNSPYSSGDSSVTTNECFTAVVATPTPTPTATPPPTATPLPTATPTPTPPPSIGALPLGYWKNHLANSKSAGPFFDPTCNSLPKGTSCSTSGPFDKQYLPKLLGNFQINDILTAAKVFSASNCSSTKDQDAIGCLTGELLATKLNLANGSLACPSILQAVADADAFLKGQTVNGVPGINYIGPSGKYTLTAAQRSFVISLKTKLNTYDSNVSCP